MGAAGVPGSAIDRVATAVFRPLLVRAFLADRPGGRGPVAAGGTGRVGASDPNLSDEELAAMTKSGRSGHLARPADAARRGGRPAPCSRDARHTERMPKVLVDVTPLRQSREFRLLYFGQIISLPGQPDDGGGGARTRSTC